MRLCMGERGYRWKDTCQKWCLLFKHCLLSWNLEALDCRRCAYIQCFRELLLLLLLYYNSQTINLISFKVLLVSYPNNQYGQRNMSTILLSNLDRFYKNFVSLIMCLVKFEDESDKNYKIWWLILNFSLYF